MVNKTQFYKTKVALAVVLSLGLAACGDSEGDAGSTSNATSQTDSTQNTVENQNELTGTVQGVVVDSNANPIEGVKVYLGDAETVTNAGGQYVFNDVAVTNVSGVNNEGGEAVDPTTSTLIVTIGGSDTHLGALVTVTPQAQVNNTGGQGTGASGGNSDTTIQTFVDGFTAEAGVAVLPALNAGAYGYIRDCRTGQPLADASDVLSLDFISVTAGNDVTTVVAGNGVQLTNAEDTHTIASDANGMFSLEGLAANSTYTATPKKGWVITTSGAGTTVIPSVAVSTLSEGSSQLLNTIEVCPVSFTPNDVSVAPFIKSIDGQIGTSTVGLTGTTTHLAASTTTPAQYAAINQGIVNDFVINFSEEMASTFDMSEARVKVIAPGSSVSATISDATVTLSADGMSATVTFATDLAEGSKVDVWFPHWTALDVNDGLFVVDNNTIIFDTVGLAVTGSTKAVYTHAYFCTFAKPTDVASVTLTPQIFDADTTEDGGSADLAGYSTAFQDNVDGGSAITQLNDGDANSGARLVLLAAARGAIVTIDQDYAVVEFDDSNAASLIWSVDGTPYTSTGTTVVPATAAFTIVQNGAQKEAHFNGVAHNDVVSVTPVNGFGDVVTAGKVSVTVVDAIAPTTVLQESYAISSPTVPGAPFAGQQVVSGTTANAAFGNGGEISAPGTTATASGEPIIYIQPRHLAGKVGNTNVAAREDEFDSLVAGMSGRLTAGEVTALGGAAAAQTAMSIYDNNGVGAGGQLSPFYDATAIAAWDDIEATIGVAFNENVTLTTTAPAFSGSTTVNGFAVNNNVAVNVDGLPSIVDLVTFDTPSVVDLSLDAGADLGFVGSVTDSRANVSTANAQVFIQDAFPPMMTASVWNGETLTLTFNETPVIPSPAANVNVIDPSNVAADLPISVSSANTIVAGNVMTITLSGAQNVAMNSRFVSGANGEFLYNDDADATEEQHALIDWDVIEDATGNSWSDFKVLLMRHVVGKL